MHRIDITDLAYHLDGTIDISLMRMARTLQPFGEIVTAAAIGIAATLAISGFDQRYVILVGVIALLGMGPRVFTLCIAVLAGVELEDKIRRRGHDQSIEVVPGERCSLSGLLADLDRMVSTATSSKHSAPIARWIVVWPFALFAIFVALFQMQMTELHLFAYGCLLLLVVLMYFFLLWLLRSRGARAEAENQASTLAVFALVAFVLTGIALYGFTEIYQVKHTTLDLTLVFAGATSFFALTQISGYWRKPSAEEALDVDPRDLSLFLRAFEDENVAVGSESVIASHGGKFYVPIENMISGRIRRHGPFVAIGDPEQKYISVGAARRRIPDGENWQDVVLEWMRKARTIVMVAARTRWTNWELGQIVTNGLTDRLLLVVPPIDEQSDAEKQARYDRVKTCFTGTPYLDELTSIGIDGLRAVTFDPHLGIVAITCRIPTDTAYELAVIIGLHRLLARDTAFEALPD